MKRNIICILMILVLPLLSYSQTPTELDLKNKLLKCQNEYYTLLSKYNSIIRQGDTILYQIDILNKKFDKFGSNQYIVGFGADYHFNSDIGLYSQIYIGDAFLQLGYIFRANAIQLGVGQQLASKWSAAVGMSFKDIEFEDPSGYISVQYKIYNTWYLNSAVDNKLGIRAGIIYNIQ